MVPEQRRHRILALIPARHQLSVNELATEFRVSRETIRRDLRDLEERGLLRKVHGGAVNLQTASETALSQRIAQQRPEKERIAARAAVLVSAGDSLFVDAGTTTAFFAQALAKRSGLTVITNSVDVASRLWQGPGENRVYLIGGEYRGDPPETVGPVALQQAAAFRADHCFLTVGAIEAEGGFRDYNIEEATIAAAMMRQARETTVLADHSKFSRTALVQVCGFAAVRRLVTDRAPAAAIGRALEAAGVELLLA